MELRVEAADGFSMPTGCFIGIRVGDVLKQRRYDAKGLYQFPLPEHRRSAKIDMYMHVGTCTTTVGPESKEGEVNVSAIDGGPEMRMRLKVSASPKPDALAERETKMTNVKKEAMDYLSKWQIQERLGEVVKKLLQKRPEDPIDFICSYLKAAQLSAKAAEPKAAEPKPVTQVLPFRAYHQHNMRSMPPQAWAKLNARFSGPKKPSAVVKSQPPVRLEQFGDYYRTHMRQVAPSGLWAGFYRKFPTRAPIPAKTEAAAAAPRGFAHTASVGTWLSRPQRVALVRGPLPAHAKTAWSLQGLPAGPACPDALREVERVVTCALLELTGDLEGEYLPLPGSTSFPARPGGMSEEDQLLVNSSGMLFEAPDPHCRGVFVNGAKDVAVWVNHGHHLQLVVKQGAGGAAAARLRAVEGALRQALRQEGHDLLEPPGFARQLRGLHPASAALLDERLEVERVLTKAFLELAGEFEGEYFPMPSSTSYAPRPGGMSKEEEEELMGAGVIFGSASATGRGVFATGNGDLLVLINGEDHVRFLARRECRSRVGALAQLGRLENAVRDALRQTGYDFA